MAHTYRTPLVAAATIEFAYDMHMSERTKRTISYYICAIYVSRYVRRVDESNIHLASLHIHISPSEQNRRNKPFVYAKVLQAVLAIELDSCVMETCKLYDGFAACKRRYVAVCIRHHKSDARRRAKVFGAKAPRSFYGAAYSVYLYFRMANGVCVYVTESATQTLIPHGRSVPHRPNRKSETTKWPINRKAPANNHVTYTSSYIHTHTTRRTRSLNCDKLYILLESQAKSCLMYAIRFVCAVCERQGIIAGAIIYN